MRKISVLLLILSLFSLFLVGCNLNQDNNQDDLDSDNQQQEENSEQRKIYNLAVESGYKGTYEEWLNSIKGDSVVLQVSNGYIQWKYSNETVWKNLISLSDLVGSKGDAGPQGEQGTDGKTSEFRVDSNFIQWRYVGENDYSWKNLLSLSVLQGNDGKDGLSGKTPELRVNEGYIQWKYIDNSEWKNLIDLKTIGGVDGLTPEFSTNQTHILWKYTIEDDSQWRELISKDELKGESGNNGQDGKTSEFRVNEGYLQWKYTIEDDSQWRNIISLEELRGEDGSNGVPGESGQDGKTPEFRVNEGYIQWKYTIEDDSQWKNIISLEDLRGEAGNDGTPGEAGQNGKTPEFREYNGYLQWKYTDEPESSWRNIISLEDLRGEAGNDGTPGESGQDGKTPEFREYDGYLQWKYTDEPESSWRNIISLEDLRGESGNDGTPGETGQDGKTPEFREYNGYLQWKYTTEDDSQWKNIYKINQETKEYVTVNFYINELIYQSVQIEKDSTLDKPLSPVKDGYKFDKWYYYDEYENEYLPWKFEYYACGTDVNLYASWEELCSVTFVDKNGNVIEQQYVEYGGYVTLPELNLLENEKVIFRYNNKQIAEDFYFDFPSMHITILCYVYELGDGGLTDDGDYTYNTYTTLMPSNWNELTYQDNNDTAILSYISGSFFEFNYKYDENGEIIDGDFTLQYSAAKKLEDITSEYAGSAAYAVPEGAQEGYAYKITLRDDLRWENGDPITAEDFVYTMQEQLNPLFKNYRADSFYNSTTVIHNAKNYVFQGTTMTVSARDRYEVWEDAQSDADLFFTLADTSGVGSYIASAYGSYLIAGYTPAWVMSALCKNASEADILALEGMKITDLLADDAAKAVLDACLSWWKTMPNEELDFFSYVHSYDEMSFDKVGLFVGENELELIIVLDKPLVLLNEDGSLSFSAGYDFSGLPLVHKATYEAHKHAPAEGSDLWTTTYNQSVDSTMSWGPYKLTYFQAAKRYVLEKNDKWYGWNMKAYENQYQTDKIVCDQVADWNTAWLKFQKGEVDSIGIDVSISADYKNSSQAIFTPDDFVGSLQLQSSADALKSREEAGKNKMLLTYPEFRKALSLAINRTAYTQACTTASKAGYGLFNSMHYYDVENGGVYRNTDVARQVLCNVYGVDPAKYGNNLVLAESKITGYNLEEARKLVEKAVAAAIEAGDYNGTDTVYLVFGTGSISEAVTRHFEYIKKEWQTLCVGTSLEGKFDMELKDFGAAWHNDFRNGEYDVCMGGWSGAAWNPGYFLLAYLDPGYMYSKAWDTANHMMKFTLTGAGEGKQDVTLELGLLEWYAILNGSHGDYSSRKADKIYNWAEGYVDTELRLGLIGALEEEILTQYYTIPTYNNFGASLISYKWDYISRDYHTFMSYGGIRYMKYNYNDAQWAQFVADHNGQIDYKA